MEERAKREQEVEIPKAAESELSSTNKPAGEKLKSDAFHLIKKDSGGDTAKILELLSKIDELVTWELADSSNSPALGSIRRNFLRNAKDWTKEGKLDRARRAVDGMKARVIDLAGELANNESLKSVYASLLPLVEQLDALMPK